jgi:ankyrin repeat protein
MQKLTYMLNHPCLVITILNRILDFASETCEEVCDYRLVSKTFDETVNYYLYPETLERIITYDELLKSIKFNADFITYNIFKHNYMRDIFPIKDYVETSYIHHKININEMLFLASAIGNHDLISMLCEFGADPNYKKTVCFIPEYREDAWYRPCSTSDMTTLSTYGENEMYDVIDDELVYVIDVSETEFVSRKASITHNNSHKFESNLCEMSALMVAAIFNNADTIRTLAGVGAECDVNFPVHEYQSYHIRGVTPLLVASTKKHYESVSALIDAGADYTTTSSRWVSVYKSALDSHWYNILNFLLDKNYIGNEHYHPIITLFESILNSNNYYGRRYNNLNLDFDELFKIFKRLIDCDGLNNDDTINLKSIYGKDIFAYTFEWATKYNEYRFLDILLKHDIGLKLINNMRSVFVIRNEKQTKHNNLIGYFHFIDNVSAKMLLDVISNRKKQKKYINRYLHCAITLSKFDVVKLFLTFDIPTSPLPDNVRNQALEMMCKTNKHIQQSDIIITLLNNGAYSDKILINAAKYRNLNLCRYILKHSLHNIYTNDWEDYAMESACVIGDTSFVEFLLNMDVSVKTHYDRQSVFLIAIRKNHQDIVRLLADSGVRMSDYDIDYIKRHHYDFKNTNQCVFNLINKACTIV